MNEDSTVVRLRQPDEIDDPLTEHPARRRPPAAGAGGRGGSRGVPGRDEGAAAAGRARAPGAAWPWSGAHGPDRDRPGRGQRVKLRDRGWRDDGERIRFTSAILPRWARRTRSLDALLPVLYLRGVSTGDFQEALAALLGKDAPNLSPSVVARLTAEWQAEYARWQRRDLSARRYVYLWADGVYLQARMEEQAECMLVLIGATPEGKKELVGFQVGVRESAQSWRELLVDLKGRGLAIAPELAIGDGALGFWKALEEVFPAPGTSAAGCTRPPTCSNKVPKSVQAGGEGGPARDLRRADPRGGRGGDRHLRREVRGQVRQGGRLPDQGPRGAAGLLRLPGRALGPPAHVQPDRERVRHRPAPHRPDQGRAVADTARLMVFKLVMAAAKTWRRLKGENQLPKVVQGVTFRDGVEVTETPAQSAA